MTDQQQKYRIINYLIQWRDPERSTSNLQTRVVTSQEEAERIIERIKADSSLTLLKAAKREATILESNLM